MTDLQTKILSKPIGRYTIDETIAKAVKQLINLGNYHLTLTEDEKTLIVREKMFVKINKPLVK